MTTATTPARPGITGGRRPRRLQRAMVGVAMAAVAFVLERVVVRALKRGGGRDGRDASGARGAGGAGEGPWTGAVG